MLDRIRHLVGPPSSIVLRRRVSFQRVLFPQFRHHPNEIDAPYVVNDGRWSRERLIDSRARSDENKERGTEKERPFYNGFLRCALPPVRSFALVSSSPYYPRHAWQSQVKQCTDHCSDRFILSYIGHVYDGR